ncbi:GumC family protein [Pseudooceanicola sp.]|uniref:GumC family protein n=1 Tax=Pseudooceanicola sp. TaxID=1914328 RepID=UPI004058A80B|tara:strand:- start:1917 stop:4106 length:2190 start_codon:yes stop_codon:yes gene_type:complete
MTDIFDRGAMPSSRMTAQTWDAVDLRAMLRGIWGDKLIIAGAAILCAVLAMLAVSQVTPQYRSMAQVLLDTRDHQVLTGEKVSADTKLSDQVVASEISILRSNTLIEAVIGQIDAEHPGALDLLDPATAEPGPVARLKGGIKGLLGKGSVDTESAENAARNRMERLTWAVRKAVEVWRDGKAYVIAIQAETPDPFLSQQLASAMTDQYIAQQLEGRRNSSTRAAEWIEERVADLRREVETAEARVEDYRARSVSTNGASDDIISRRMVSLNDELVAARVARVAAEASFSEVQRLISEGGYDRLGNMFTSDAIGDLSKRRLELMASDAQWAQNYDTSHPERRKIARQLEEVNRALQVEFERGLDTQRNDLQIARLREQTLRESLNETEEQFLAVSRSSIGLRQLERQAEAARKLYTDLLDRYAETRTQQLLDQSDARVIERATIPTSPAAPRPKLMVTIGLFAGALIGFGIVAVRQLSTRLYRTPADLANDTGVPILTAIPERDWVSTARALRDIETDPMGPVAESVRKLRNALALTGEDSEPQSIALLSPLQAEGKTTTTVLLARMTEMADKLVCIVDCDFRKNSIQQENRFAMQHDLDDLMHGECSVLDALCTDTGMGFDLLAARDCNPQLADRLTANWLEDTLTELKQYYDVVLVNCPPMLAVADTLLVAQAVDQRVMLMRHNSTPRMAVRRSLSLLEHHGLDVSGQVVTHADIDLKSDEYFYQHAY